MKYYYTLLFLTLFFPALFFGQTKITSKSELNEKGYLQFISANPSKTDHNEKNVQLYNNYYRNKKYKFRIKLIPNWEIIKGDAIGILVGNAQRDSGKTISIGLREYVKPLKSYVKLSISGIEEYKKFLTETNKIQNRDISIVKIENTFLCNFSALRIVSTQIEKTLDGEIEYYNEIISCIANGNLYTISFSTPLILATKIEKERFYNFIDNFKFEFGLY